MPAHDSSSALISDDASARVESEAAMPRSVGSTSARSLETVSAVELGEGGDIRAAGVRTAGSGRRGARAHATMVANTHMYDTGTGLALAPGARTGGREQISRRADLKKNLEEGKSPSHNVLVPVRTTC